LTEYERKMLTEFLSEYVHVAPAGLDKLGFMTERSIRQAWQMLTEEKIFTSKEITRKILKKYNYLFPESRLIKEF